MATDLKAGERVRLIGEKEEGIYEVLEVRDGAFRTAFDPASDKVFVFGREVKDFRSVDYEALSMLNVSGTQELAKRVETLEARESHLAALDQEVADLKKMVAQLTAEGRGSRETSRAVPPVQPFLTVAPIQCAFTTTSLDR